MQQKRATAGRRGALTSALIYALAAVLALAGLWLLIKPKYTEHQQDKGTQDLMDAMDQGLGYIEVDPNAYPVEGEEGEETAGAYLPQLLQPGPRDPSDATPMPAVTIEPATVRIYGAGQIHIPRINLTMPIAVGATRVTLRYAVGWAEGTPAMGQMGRCVIYGHRMRQYGRHFNRLDEVGIGDTLILQDLEGRQYVYTVYRTLTVLPDDVRKYYSGSEGREVMLVTCTPLGVSSHRLLVFGRMEDPSREPSPTPAGEQDGKF